MFLYFDGTRACARMFVVRILKWSEYQGQFGDEEGSWEWQPEAIAHISTITNTLKYDLSKSVNAVKLYHFAHHAAIHIPNRS